MIALVLIRDSSVSVVHYRTILTMDFLDEKYRVPSNAISRFRLILRNASRYPFFLNISNNANESWKKSLRMDIVENISNMIIAGDISDFKKSFCITLPLRFLHCSLIRQKRWDLNEKHRKKALKTIPSMVHVKFFPVRLSGNLRIANLSDFMI